MGVLPCIPSGLPAPYLIITHHKAMLDVMTLFAAVNIQSDLEQANVEKGENIQALVVNDSDSGQEGSVGESVAEELSSAFDAFEGALGSIFGAPESPAPPVHNKTKKLF